MQNGNQGSNQWTFIFYDALGREVIRGLCIANSLPDISTHSMITEFSTSAAGLFQTGYICPEIVKNGINYTKLLTTSYYDNYNFLNLSCLATHKSSLSYGFENGTHPTDYAQQYIASPENLSAKGLLTGTGTGLMEENIVLFASLYYDDKDQIVQSRSMNHLGKYEKNFFSYSFSGKVLKHLHIHTANEKEMQTELYTYVYDHAERLQEVRHKLNGNSEVKLAINTYDKLGRLKTKTHHGTSGHKLTYEYNIRNWLTQINGTLFEQNLYYNTGNGSQCYNGNIGSMTWKSGEDGIRGYKFTYDNMSRMRNAIYGEGTSITPPTGKNFSENVIGYDYNGNITGLQRYGKVSGSTYGKIDDLSLTYVGNQLNNVTDAATDPLYNGAFNFVDGNKTSIQEYKYDANGNLEQDYNKKIAKIQYNSLNLPSTLQFANANSTNYLYDADGMKRRVIHKTAIANISVPMGQIKELANSQISQTNTTDYCSNVIYENGVLSMILTEEGYVTLNGDIPIYHYYLKDHQGNNRIVMNQNGTTVEQVNHYYPFGVLFEEGLATSDQNYKYNSKELDRMHGLDWYDYEARHYDTALGRFTVMDPLAEKYYWISSYTYCLNNPTNLIDPDGRDWYRVKDENNEWTYLWSTEIHSQKELDKTIKGAEYLGLTYKSDNTYYSLFGQTEDANTKEGKAMSKLDASIINYVDFLKESIIDSEIKQRQTDFDIGAYARTSVLGLTEDTYFSFEYGAQGNTGIAYYYMIGRGQQNKGTFESWTTTNRFTYNSNRGTGSMKSGYNLRFPRSGGSSNNWSARVVFTTKEAKNNTYSIFKKLFFYENK